MRTIKTWIPVLLILVSLSVVGCDDRKSKDRLNSLMNSWVGRNVNEFVRSYGPPTATFTLPNGNTVYSYKTDREQTVKNPIYERETRDKDGGKSTVTTGGEVYVDRDFCEINVEFDRSSKILTWRYEGDSPKHCKIKNLSQQLQRQLAAEGIIPQPQ